jgi:hypothetical protein
MPTTRSTHLLRRTLALAAAPALVLTVAACGDDGGGGDAASFCEDVADPFGAAQDPNADPQETVETLRDLDPPSEISDDWNTLLDALETIASMSAEDAASEEAIETLSDPEIAEAGENVEAYLTDECGITPP